MYCGCLVRRVAVPEPMVHHWRRRVLQRLPRPFVAAMATWHKVARQVPILGALDPMG